MTLASSDVAVDIEGMTRKSGPASQDALMLSFMPDGGLLSKLARAGVASASVGGPIFDFQLFFTK